MTLYPSDKVNYLLRQREIFRHWKRISSQLAKEKEKETLSMPEAEHETMAKKNFVK